MMYKLMLILLCTIGSISLHAQRAILVDSVMFDTSRSVDYLLSMDSIGRGPQALISYVTGNENPHEVIFKGKAILKLPPASSLYYINDTMMLVEKYEKDGDKWWYRRLVRYRIEPEGRITLQDSISLGEPEIGRLCDGFLPKRPLVVTTNDAVEGGGCTSVFRIYDENLRIVKTILPFPESCGLGNRVYVQEDELTFVSVDASDEHHLFYGSIDYMTLETKSINHIRVDASFFIQACYYVKGNLYLSGSKKTKGSTPENYPLMIFDQKGNLVRTLKLHNIIKEMTSDIKGNMYWLDVMSNFYVNGKIVSNIKAYQFHGEYISSYPKPNSKIYFYEIK